MFVVAQLKRKWTQVPFDCVLIQVLLENAEQVVNEIHIATLIRIGHYLSPIVYLAALKYFDDVHSLHLVVDLLELAN